MGLGDTNPEMLASPIVFTARRDAIHSIASLSQDVYPVRPSVRLSVIGYPLHSGFSTPNVMPILRRRLR